MPTPVDLGVDLSVSVPVPVPVPVPETMVLVPETSVVVVLLFFLCPVRKVGFSHRQRDRRKEFKKGQNKTKQARHGSMGHGFAVVPRQVTGRRMRSEELWQW